MYIGTKPFSEPETQAMRDFMTSKKNELKFVMNFHQFGAMFLIPYHGVVPNNLADEHPEVAKIFQEMVEESVFPAGTNVGSAGDTLGP